MKAAKKYAFGGYKVQGRDLEAAKKLIDDADAVEKAGAFALVLECVPTEIATKITEKLTIPTIGIGAGNGCDGQVLVYQDMLGMFSDYTPKFVKQYANVGTIIKDAVTDYINEVNSGAFPDETRSYKASDDVLEKLY